MSTQQRCNQRIVARQSIKYILHLLRAHHRRKTRRTQHALEENTQDTARLGVFDSSWECCLLGVLCPPPRGSAVSSASCVPPPRVPVPYPRPFRIGISQASSFISVYSGGLSSGLPGAPTARTTIVSTVAALPWRKLSRGRPSGKRSISSISMTSAGTHAGFSPPLIEVPWVTADLVVQKPISPRKHVNCRHRTAILTRYEWRH